jgi:hypothetical protein
MNTTLETLLAARDAAMEAMDFAGFDRAQAALNKFTKSETPLYEDQEFICDCYTCGAPMTDDDVNDIPPEEFHEDCPECEDCRATKTKKTEEEAEADKEAYRVREEARYMKMLGETEGKAYAAEVWAKMWDETEEDEEAALQAAVLTQKVNPNADQGPAMKVLMRTQEDGRVEVVMPMGVPPDTRGYNLNRAFQKERKSKVVARLQKKLAAKQKTLVDHARDLVEKALTPSK